jgi:hypothetical protein
MLGGFISEADIALYMPTSDFKKINRKFVWGVYGHLNKLEAITYYQQVFDSKMLSRLP